MEVVLYNDQWSDSNHWTNICRLYFLWEDKNKKPVWREKQTQCQKPENHSSRIIFCPATSTEVENSLSVVKNPNYSWRCSMPEDYMAAVIQSNSYGADQMALKCSVTPWPGICSIGCTDIWDLMMLPTVTHRRKEDPFTLIRWSIQGVHRKLQKLSHTEVLLIHRGAVDVLKNQMPAGHIYA